MTKLKPENSEKNRKAGFTLLEILVVMVIIGILATMGLGSYLTSQMKARDARRKQELRQIANAVELFYNDYGVFPSSTADHRIIGCGSSYPPTQTCNWGAEFSLAGNLFIALLPLDNNGPYKYVSSGTDYRIYTFLENDKDPQIRAGLGVICSGTTECNFAVSSTNAPL